MSTAALAQAQAPASPRAGRHEMGPGFEGRGARGLFRGIVLSNAEQAKVKEIRAKYETEEKSIHEAMQASE